MYGETSNTLRLGFQPTNACNLRCSYCYQNNKGHDELPVADAKFVLDKLFEGDKEYFRGFIHDDYLNVILDFIGGEITLYMDFVEEITEYFIAKCVEHRKDHWLINFEVWLETNGTTYFKPQVQNYIRKHCHRMNLPLTLDGAKVCHDSCRVYHDGRGSYDDVVKAIKHYITEYGKVPNVKVTMAPENIEHMFEGIKEFIELGFPQIRLSCVNEDVWQPYHDGIWQRELRKFYDFMLETNTNFFIYPLMKDEMFTKGLVAGTCGCFGNMLYVNYKGELNLCHRFSDISDLNGKPVFTLGSVKEGITEEGIKHIKHIEESRIKTCQTEGCVDCEIGQSCEHCPAFNYQHYGHTHGTCRTNCVKQRIAFDELKRYRKLLQERQGAVGG